MPIFYRYVPNIGEFLSTHCNILYIYIDTTVARVGVTLKIILKARCASERAQCGSERHPIHCETFVAIA